MARMLNVESEVGERAELTAQNPEIERVPLEKTADLTSVPDVSKNYSDKTVGINRTDEDTFELFK